jgi:uncharacterized protein YcfJ
LARKSAQKSNALSSFEIMRHAMHKTLRLGTIAVAALVAFAPAWAQVTFYEDSDFQGRTFNTANDVPNFRSHGFNDRASSVVVLRERWEVCEDADFAGRCMVLRPGDYPSLASMGLNDRISSVRALSERANVDDARYAPQRGRQLSRAQNPEQDERGYDARRRGNERLFKARVVSTRAVVGPAEQRCWVEPGQVGQSRGDANVPGGVVGALLGGILGHQIGGGRGRDIATAAGAVGGAVVGANVGRERGQDGTPDVRRCEDRAPNPNARPAYWDVSYTFRGQEHRVQMTSPPGATITVNSQGEPRV